MPPEQGGKERLPPQSKEAERCVLGSMLRDNGVIGDVVQILRDENFYSDAHQKIYAVLLDIHIAGKPVDLVIVFEELKKRKQAEDTGGAAYMAELLGLAPTAANGIGFSPTQ